MDTHCMHDNLSHVSQVAGSAAHRRQFPSRIEAEAEQMERQVLTALALLGLGGLAVAGALALKSKYSKKEIRHD